MNNGPFVSISNLSIGDILTRKVFLSGGVVKNIAWIVIHIEKSKTLTTVTLFDINYSTLAYCNNYISPDIFVLAKV